jgi:hypothetical protein
MIWKNKGKKKGKPIEMEWVMTTLMGLNMVANMIFMMKAKK